MNQNLKKKKSLLLERNYVFYLTGPIHILMSRLPSKKCQCLRRNFIEEKVYGCMCVSEVGGTSRL